MAVTSTSATIGDQSLAKLGGRASILARQRADHARLDRLMARARETAAAGGIAHQVALRAVARLVFTHAFAEEDELLPRLQQLLTPRELRLLGFQWELVRRVSPTRPHPLVSRRPPGQALSALPLTLLDRARDLLQRLEEITRCRFTVPLSTADRYLAAASEAVERIPVLQRGERSETSR
jgi:hypothetical protein